MKHILFLNACVDRERSRTLRLAREVLRVLKTKPSSGGSPDKAGKPAPSAAVTEVILENEKIPPLDTVRLSHRQAWIDEGLFSGPFFSYARQFRDADQIVVAAPYWDFCFPAILKTYLEAVSVPGLTYRYTPEGDVEGLCRASRLIYVTTRGGYVTDEEDLGYQILRGLCGYFGIPDVRCVSVSGLDVPPFDVRGKLARKFAEIPEIVR